MSSLALSSLGSRLPMTLPGYGSWNGPNSPSFRSLEKDAALSLLVPQCTSSQVAQKLLMCLFTGAILRVHRAMASSLRRREIQALLGRGVGDKEDGEGWWPKKI